MRVDPVGEGLNLYLYTQNNPLKYIDPRGLTTRSYQNTTSYQQPSTGGVGSFSDGSNEYSYDYTPNQNVSLTSRNQEVPGIPDYSIPKADPVPTTTFLSSGNIRDQVADATPNNSLVGPISGGVAVATGTAERISKSLSASNKIIQGIKYTGYGAIAVNAYTALREGRDAFNQREYVDVAKAGLDITMAGVGVLGGIGFGISTTYYALDSLGYVDSAFEIIDNSIQLKYGN